MQQGQMNCMGVIRLEVSANSQIVVVSHLMDTAPVASTCLAVSMAIMAHIITPAVLINVNRRSRSVKGSYTHTPV